MYRTNDIPEQEPDKNWLAFCEGDQSAFLNVYDLYYTLLFTWGCKWLPENHELVKDTLHDFFIYLWDKRERLSKNINTQSYLLTSFKRRLLYSQSIQKRLTDRSDEDLYTIPADNDEQLAAELFAERFANIQRALDLLPPAQREVIELRYLENKSFEEIAAIKQSSVRTVYNLMHRALATLREEAQKKNFIFLW